MYLLVYIYMEIVINIYILEFSCIYPKFRKKKNIKHIYKHPYSQAVHVELAKVLV